MKLQTEMLPKTPTDAHLDSAPATIASTNSSDEIGFKDAIFSWVKPDNLRTSAYKSAFKLRFDGEVLFAKNKINLIVGPTASGKTSLLMAILGEIFILF